MVTFKFSPISKKQRQILNWWMPQSPVHDAEGIIADGAIRSGKTLMMSLSFIMWSMQTFNGENLAMCGKTVGSFRRNVLSVLKRVLPSRGYSVTDKRADNMMIVRRGDVTNYYYFFGGKDERSQDLIQGITLAGVLLDEVALMPQSFVNQACARCSVDGSKIWFNCNPDAPMHWFNQEWIKKSNDKNLLHLHFTMADNLSLSDSIRKRYEMMYSGVFYQRYILGLWAMAEGLVYDFGEDNITDDVPQYGEYYISVDYGTMNPFSAGLWCVNGGKAVRIKEYYYNGRATAVQKTDEEYCDEVEKLAEGYEIRKVVVDPSAASFIASLRKRNFSVLKANNDVLDGIRTVSVMLKGGNIKIHRCCADTIREFGLYSWDEKTSEDKVIKDNDHSMDDIRYFCKTILIHKLRTEYQPIWN